MMRHDVVWLWTYFVQPKSLFNLITIINRCLLLSSFGLQVQTLIEDVQKLQSTLNQLRESSARQLSHFEEELQVRSRHIQRLEAQLEAQKDYKEIRRELRYCCIY